MMKIEKGIFFPAPVKLHRIFTSGRDFLGQQSIIQRMADELLPSFTNSTRRLRYYSFWAWAFEMAKIHTSVLKSPEERWYYLQKLETALIITNKSINSKIKGVIGVRNFPLDLSALPNLDDAKKVQIYYDYNRTTSYSPTRYSPSLSSLNIAERNGDEILLHRHGKQLAEAFDKKIRRFGGYRDLISPKSKSISWGKLKAMQSALSLSEVLEEEKAAFHKVLEQKQYDFSAKDEIPARILSALLLLDIIKKCNIKNTDDLRHAFINGVYYPANKQLENIWGGERVIETRRYYQFAVETILSSFCRYLNGFNNSPATFDSFCSSVYEGLKNYKLSGSKTLLKASDESINFEKFCSKVLQILNKDGISEIELYDRIWKCYKKWKFPFDSDVTITAIILIIYLYNNRKEIKKIDSRHAAEFYSYPHDDLKHSLRNLEDFINGCFDLPVYEAFRKIILELSLKLHLSVTRDRLFQTSNFTFRFVRSETSGFELLEGMIPTMTSNKVFAFFSLIEDMGLVEMKGSFYKLSSTGNSFYKRFLK